MGAFRQVDGSMLAPAALRPLKPRSPEAAELPFS
jgi:hypothetical protein